MTRDGPSGGAEPDRSDRYESIIEAMADGVFVLDRDGAITVVNDAAETYLGLDRETLVGTTFARLTEEGLIDRAEYDRFLELFQSVTDGDDTDRRMTIGDTQRGVLELRLRAKPGGETVERIVGTVRDVTQRARALESIERQQWALYRLYEIDVDSELTVDEKIQRALDVGCEFLDLPIGFMSSVDGDTQRFERVVGFDDLEGSSRSLQSSYCRFTVENDDPVAIRDAETELGSDDPTYAETEVSCYVGTKIPVNGELYGTFCFAAADARDRSFSAGEREFVRLLGLWAGHNLERQHTERVLRELHEKSRELMLADSKEAVARIGVDAIADLFDLPITACWRYDEAADVLRPLAETRTAKRLVGETPSFERGEALAWKSFDSGETRTFEDLSTESDTYNPGTPIASEIHIPLGRQGVIVSASTDPRRFENIDVESLNLLGSLVRDALASVEQQEAIEERGEALQRQNERLEEFARVVAHDLRNPLAGAVGFLEIARETHDERHFDRVKSSHDRMQEMIDELLDIARGARQEADPRELSLIGIVTEAWSYVDAPDATLSVSEDLGVIYADETRLLQLFGNLFRNSVQHAGPDVTVEVGRLPSGFYVADDGPGLPEGAREDVLTLGKTYSSTGTGIGLRSVTDIVDAHGWELAIPDIDGGTRFEIRTDRATEAEL